MLQVKINIIKEVMKNYDEYKYQNKNIFYHVVQIGCGANGSYVAEQVAHMLSTYGVKHKYLLADFDTVESKNLRNQRFIEKDVGLKKAQVLARRYRASYGIDIGVYDASFVEDIQTLQKLFKQPVNVKYSDIIIPILISCVDNNYTRKIFHEYFEQEDTILYLDVGVEASKLPKGKTLQDMKSWTEEEMATFKSSGFTGQVVAGLKLEGETILEPVAERFSDILEDNDEIAPSEVACSQVIASNPQRVITNRLAGWCTSAYISELLDSGCLSNHITYFHAKKNMVRSVPITI